MLNKDGLMALPSQAMLHLKQEEELVERDYFV